MRNSSVSPFFALGAAFLALALLASPAAAQNLNLSVSASDGAKATVTVENTYDFELVVVNVRLSVATEGGGSVHYFSQDSFQETLEPGQRWQGTLTFAAEDGSAPPAGIDWTSIDRASVAGGLDLDALQADTDAALQAGTWDALSAQLNIVKPRIAPVSRSARFHTDHLAGSGLARERWFNLERADAMRDSLERALCDWASTQVLQLRGRTETRVDAYNELGSQLQGVGLHISCLNSAGKLAAARMLIESNRPQDALIFKEVDENGNLLPEWVDLTIRANLALARVGAEAGVTAFATLRPSVEALNTVQDIAPENPELLRLAGLLIPTVAGWIIEQAGPLEQNMDGAQEALRLIRPRWSQFERVEQAAAAFADSLIAVGLEFCSRREYVNARNRFIRGEEMLAGVPAWEEKGGEINHCRAMGALAEGRELASNVNDDRGPQRGFDKLEEALRRHPLSEAEVNEFKADIAQAWTALALHQLGEGKESPRFEAAERSLENAESMSPAGRTDAMRNAWIRVAERYVSYYGFTLNGMQVDRAHAALEKAENVDPQAISAVSGQITRAFYALRVWAPVGGVVLVVLVGGIAWMRKRRMKSMLESDDF